MADFDEVDSIIREFTADDATIIYGTVIEDSMNEDELLVTVVATGVNQKLQLLQLITQKSYCATKSCWSRSCFINQTSSQVAHRLQRT